ncbi:hypothetical protein BCV70DRAFT_69364 [Testicularia cyperi]|uniref:GCFC-domain-containing protein n=1 Tax=Testicularia cyperi TaxID=1882483 RepID=A0A317XGE5_9BASI|nr:hypothetical protein BCV70DRAFT_69364 [Testicularia cyperi]
MDMDIDPAAESRPMPQTSGASFVKRSKPRTSGIRQRNTVLDSLASLDTEDDISQAGPSRSRSPATPEASVQSRPTSDRDEDASSNVVFRSRAKGARGSSTSSSLKKTAATSSSLGRLAVTAADVPDDDNDEPVFEIRRSKLGQASRLARAKEVIATGSIDPKSLKPSPKPQSSLRPSVLKGLQTHRSDDVVGSSSVPLEGDAATSEAPPTYTPAYLQELRLSTPTLSTRASSPMATAGPSADGTDPVDRLAARVADMDQGPNLAEDSDDALLRAKFGADFDHDGIPSESAIRAAKEKRAKLRAAYLEQERKATASEDYISLGPTNGSSKAVSQDEPHRHSRLVREDDEIGDGQEEFAEFTEALDTLPIGEKAQQAFREQQRREMEAALNGGHVANDDNIDTGTSTSGHKQGRQNDQELDMDEDEKEWEQAQLRRMELDGSQTKSRSRSHGKHESSRPRSTASDQQVPWRAAPIPASTPLPNVNSASGRLSHRLAELETSTAAHTRVIESAEATLAELDEAEELNKADVIAVEDKASWFRELETFVVSLAKFMDQKTKTLDEIESDATQLFIQRSEMICRQRSELLEDAVATFWGVPATALVVSPGSRSKSSGANGASSADTDQDLALDPAEERDPRKDGPCNSLIRHSRRAAREPMLAALINSEAMEYQKSLALDRLPPEDEASYQVALQELSGRVSRMFDDVLAPEYRDPAAGLRLSDETVSIPRTADTVAADAQIDMDMPHGDENREQNQSEPTRKGTEGLHPRSVVSRFAEWRARYPTEYAQVWGGLSVAQIWQFYARREMVLWSLSGSPEGGWSDLARARWFTGLKWYVENASTLSRQLCPEGDGAAGAAAPEGGEEEALASVIAEVVVPRLSTLCSKTLDVWSTNSVNEVLSAMDTLRESLGASDDRYGKLVDELVSKFSAQTERLEHVFSSPFSFQGQLATTGTNEVGLQATAFLIAVLQLWSNLVSVTKSLSSNHQTCTELLTRLSALVQSLMNQVSHFLNREQKARLSAVAASAADMLPSRFWTSHPQLQSFRSDLHRLSQ